MRTEFTSSDKILVTNSNGTTYRGNLNQFFKYIHTMSGSNSINSSQDYVISTNNINRFEITSTGNINMGTSISMPTIHIASTNTMEGDRIGIFTNNPRTPLEINSKTSGSSGLSFTLFNSGSTNSVGAPIGVDKDGNVVKVFEPVKKYVALIEQVPDESPTATILYNTLDGTPTWNRDDMGVYTCTLTNSFPLNKTFLYVQQPFTLDIKIRRKNDNVIDIKTFEQGTEQTPKELADFGAPIAFTPTWNFGQGDGTIRCTGGGFTEGRTGISILGSESTNTTATWISTSEISLSSWNMNPGQTMIKILIEIRIYKQ